METGYVVTLVNGREVKYINKEDTVYGYNCSPYGVLTVAVMPPPAEEGSEEKAAPNLVCVYNQGAWSKVDTL